MRPNLASLLLAAAVVWGQTGGAQLVQTINFNGAGGCPGMRLGDINGDGKYEIVVAQPMPQPDAHTPQEVVRVTAYSLTGTQLWQYTRPGGPNLSNHSASSDIPLQVYDWDGDGAAEVIAAFSNTTLTLLNGRNGQVLRTIPIPQGTSANGPSGSNDCIIIANLRGTPWPQDFIVKTRYTQVWGLDGRNGSVLWTYQKRGNADNLAHYGYVFDRDGDGRDEYLSGWQLHSATGAVLWNASGLTMHIDAASVGELDGNAQNGKEIAVGSQVGVVYRANTGQELWRDNNVTPGGQGIQHIAIGDFVPARAGKEVVMLERIGPRDATGRDANILVSSTGQLISKENRTGNDYGWVTVTERLRNWDSTGRDLIFSYRRTSKPPALYDGSLSDPWNAPVATFPHSGGYMDFVMHGDLCGDAREEVIVYNETTAWIFANGGCNLNEPPRQASLPQNRRHYNWSIYSGWEDVDYTFYTPGSVRIVREGGIRLDGSFLTVFPSEKGLAFRLAPNGVFAPWSLSLHDARGRLLARSGSISGREWIWKDGNPLAGAVFLSVTSGGKVIRRLIPLWE